MSQLNCKDIKNAFLNKVKPTSSVELIAVVMVARGEGDFDIGILINFVKCHGRFVAPQSQCRANSFTSIQFVNCRRVVMNAGIFRNIVTIYKDSKNTLHYGLIITV